MNEQNSGERLDTWGIVERSENDTNGGVAVHDPVTDEVPVEAAVMHETPMGETVAAVGPMDESIVYEAPMAEPNSYKPPVDEPVADEPGVIKSVPYMPPMGQTITQQAPVGTKDGSSEALLSREESEHFRTRWNEIQSKFVDEPRSAVQTADALVSEVVEQITKMFATEHSTLESQWNQGNDVSTEDLRKALQHYRSFFNRLVA